MNQRRAARLVLLDAEGRVLLLRHASDRGASFWATPGGGLDPGESFEAAALREAREELGVDSGTVRFLFEREAVFDLTGVPVQQQERYFLFETQMPLALSGAAEVHRAEGILEWKWWTAAELDSTDETVYPRDLGARIADLGLAGAASR